MVLYICSNIVMSSRVITIFFSIDYFATDLFKFFVQYNYLQNLVICHRRLHRRSRYGRNLIYIYFVICVAAFSMCITKLKILKKVKQM